MNGQQQQGQSDGTPLLDDITDPKNPRVTLVPNDRVDEAIRLGAKRISTANYQNSLNKARLQKPSAAAPTPTVPAVTPPATGKPVPGAPGVTTTSPGGVTKVPGQTLGAGATGTAPGVTPEQFSNIGQFAKGVGKELGRDTMRIFAPGMVGAGMLPSSLKPATTGPEYAGSQTVQFMENWLPMGATEKLGVGAIELLAKTSPKIAEYAKIPVGLVARGLYNIGVEGATAKAQGRDPVKAMETAALFSAVTEPMAMAAPEALRMLFGVKEEMGKDIGRKMLEMSEASGLSWLKSPTLDKLKGKIGPYTREAFNERAEKLYNAAAQQVNKTASQASRNYQKTAVYAGAMMDDIEKAIKNASAKNKGALRRMLNDVQDTVGGFADSNLQKAMNKRNELEATIKDLNQKIPGQRPMVQRASQQLLAIKSQELTDTEKMLRNIPVMTTPAKLNQLRRKIGDNWVQWGKSNAELKEAEAYGRKLYNQISDQVSNTLSKVDPNIKQALNTENAMRDIWKGTAKEIHAGIGIHSLGKPGVLPKVGATFGGWSLGERFGEATGFGRLPGGVAGAIIGSRAANPLVTGAARAAHSGLTRGLPMAIEQTFGGDNYPDQDWSKKGKTTPYGNME